MRGKYIFGGIIALTVAIVASFNISLSTQQKGINDILLANLDALAQGEFPGFNKHEVKVVCTYNDILYIECYGYFFDVVYTIPITEINCYGIGQVDCFTDIQCGDQQQSTEDCSHK
ncbi:NVEALA domain-containing protein [Viscerimonas tarda]